MFGAKAYAQVGLESGVNSASPHQLILMLYDGAVQAIIQAQIYMASNAIEEKGAAISKAIRIIDEGLKAGLDMKTGGDLVEQLSILYGFVSRELILASAQSDPQRLQDCIDLLKDLRGAWAAIGSPQPQPEAITP
ncbi:MAG: flagellar export chaperone FliS [Burkholderiaceae bacterium]|jgi:flagellar protein FliS